MTDLSEAELIGKIKSGDEKSFEYVFKTYYSGLAVFAKKYVYDLEIGKEIVQDLFVKLYENKENLQITSSLKSYLFTSVKNKCLTYISQNQLRVKHHEVIANSSPGATFDEVDYLEQTELEEKVFNSINSLPEQCRRIFKMNRLDGKRNKEIAEELNISIRTVETQISKALKFLREKLSDYVLIISLFIICVKNF